MTTKERFWTHRLLWRLRGGLVWPAFFALTLADALILTRLPPVRTGVDFVPGLILASFANLFLIGLVGPWLARRLHRRDPQGPPLEVLADRAGSILLAIATVGIVAAGLATRPLVVSETEDTEAAAGAVQAHIEENANAEVRRNLDTANTIRLEEDLFRICVALDDRTRASCYFVDTSGRPPRVTEDGDARPNALYRP
ncbi:MAG: hypothetical protein WD844_12675 [Thermoleophilaceae bacterium]